MSKLKRQLSAIEPDERTYEGIGPSEVDLLRKLLDNPEAWLAARAAHALTRIKSANARDALLSAAQNPQPEVRTALAAAAGKLPRGLSDRILKRLLSDSEIGVRKFAIKAISDRNSGAIKQRVREIATTDTDAALRKIAREKRKSLSPP